MESLLVQSRRTGTAGDFATDEIFEISELIAEIV